MAEDSKQTEGVDYLILPDFLDSRLEASEQQETKQKEFELDIINVNIESLIKTEIRPFQIGWFEFSCNINAELTMKRFKQTICNSLKLVQKGLYILLRLAQPINWYAKPRDIINILLSLYQIIDNLSSKTHGLTFDSRIAIIYNPQIYHTLTGEYLCNSNMTKLPISHHIDMESLNQTASDQTQCKLLNKYRESVFGGTFDHLHSGHKVLISIACLLASNALYIGLSVDKLLANKKYAHMLQSFEKRREILLNFISFIKPDLKVMLEPLNDLYGPSIYESIEVLVISKETVKGGDAVNQKRKELKRAPLELIVVDFIVSSENKISSTAIRCLDEKYQFLYNQWNRLILQLLSTNTIARNTNMNMQFIEEWWHVLFNFYQQRHRFYHSLNHIYDLIEKCIKYSNMISDVTVMLLAIWFHDIVYDPRRKDNELRSIQVFNVFVAHFRRIFGDVLLPNNIDLLQKVTYFIEATVKHQIKEEYGNDMDLRLFLDLDLSVLAQQEDAYKVYAENVRKEYIHIESPVFEQKRAQIMQMFLDRKELYFTSPFKQQFEANARHNVANEIKMLQIAANSNQ